MRFFTEGREGSEGGIELGVLSVLGVRDFTEGREGNKGDEMHPLYEKADRLSREVIGAAIEVHRLKGPGLIESIYERCLIRELSLRNIMSVNQKLVPVEYKGYVFEEPLRLDVLVEGCLLLELKVVEKILPIHKAQLLSYMKLMDIPLGLIINFHEMKLVDGICRLILPGADKI
jgi:GxxExxY protein